MTKTPVRDPVATPEAAFPAPSRDDWRALAIKTLKGAPLDSLDSTTADGLVVPALGLPRDEAPPLSARRAPAGDAQRPWDLRTVVDHPDPGRAGQQGREDLESGAASLLLRLDPTGADGVAIGDADDLARALAGVILDAASVALDAGLYGPQAANALAMLAKGAPQARLAFHLDPLSAFAEAGFTPGPVESHLVSAAQTLARHAPAYPQATGFLASGRVIHEAGGSDGQELGVMAAAALAYAKAATRAGLSMAQAFEAIVLGLSVDQTYLEAIAKLRAARAIWTRLTRACGVVVPARIEARSSRRMLSSLDPWTNLLRLTAAGFAAGVGGADAVILEPFTRPLGGAGELARRQARNTQLVLMQESHIGRVADPAGGAWFFDHLTDDLARAGWAFFQSIEARGGLISALESGWVTDSVAGVRAVRERDLAQGRSVILGATVFRDADPKAVPVDTVDPAPLARTVEVRLPGPDSRCPPLTPHRLSAPYETAPGARPDPEACP